MASFEFQKERLRKKLWYLKERHGISGIKGGTEVEDLSFRELKILRELSEGLLPMTVKIGGAEARNDMRECMKLGVEQILAPMIESEYAFRNFVESVESVHTNQGMHTKNFELALNIESITAYSNLNSILYHPAFSEKINQVTVGRSDLSRSMEENEENEEDSVDHDSVVSVVQDIVQRVRHWGKRTSVGGKITPASAERIKRDIQPDAINTRHVLIDSHQTKDLTFSVCESLQFEIDLYRFFIECLDREDLNKELLYTKRIEENKQRIQDRSNSPLLVS